LPTRLAMKMMLANVAILLVAAVSAGNLKGSPLVAPLATDAVVSLNSVSVSATNAAVDKLIHLLVEDEKKAKKETEEKDSKAKAAGKKEPTDEFKAFLPGCLQHTNQTIQMIDRSYTDAQLKTVLQNECLLSKEFPLTKKSGFHSHSKCMDFADKLSAARNAELKDAKFTGGNLFKPVFSMGKLATGCYNSFCESFYEHETGKKANGDGGPVKGSSGQGESIASGRSFSFAVLAGIVTLALLQK